MAVSNFNFTTGPSTLKDVEVLSYNGCTFSPLFETKLSGNIIKDNANRTTKFMEYAIVVDGYVTLPAGQENINKTMRDLRNMLTAQGGALVYKGRGFDIVVNSGVRDTLDVAWGPVPELIEFQPLGAGRSAKIQWKVTTRIPEVSMKASGILQLNYETSVSYAEDGFSSLSVRGTIEVGITRTRQESRNVEYTIDKWRHLISDRVLASIDLDKFRVVRRDFNISRDKRTMEWNVEAEERPYMDLPSNCTVARGTYNVRPAKVGMGLVSWLCTLKATYTVRKSDGAAKQEGAKRRTAWIAFLALMRLRMEQGGRFLVDMDTRKKDDPTRLNISPELMKRILNNPKNVWLIDFSIDEGLYLDSKTVTFSATWRLMAEFKNILLSSGLWRKVEEKDSKGNNLWAASMKKFSGAYSWLRNELDPNVDIIVDFGSDTR